MYIIPKSFRLFSTKIDIVIDNERLNELKLYGQCDYGQSKIFIAEVQERKSLSNDKIKDTYYHEKVHMILDTMGEDKLSSDEKFVDLFSKLLRQSDETSEF
jgi:hypothetical protein